MAHDGSSAVLSILVVEDEAIIALELADALASAGLRVLGPATTVADGRALAEQERVDAAVLDIMLSDGSVWELADRLQDRGIPYLLTTGLDSRADWPLRHREAPMLAKPSHPGRFVEAVRKMVAAARR